MRQPAGRMILPQVGELKERIDILNVTAPYNLDGAGTIVSVAAGGLWAKIEPLGGEVGAQGMQIQSCTQAYRVWIRYRTGLTPWQQIRWGGRRLTIAGPMEEMERRFILIHAEERTSRQI